MLLTYLGLVAVVVVVGLFVLMPATWLATSAAFLLYPPLDSGWFYVRGAATSAVLLLVAVLVPALRRRVSLLLGTRAAGTGPTAGRPRRARARELARLVTVLAVVLSPLIVANLLVAANGAWDSSSAVTHETVVLAKHASGGGRSAVLYSLRVPSWKQDASFHEVRVTRRAFEDAAVGMPLTLTTRAGRFGRDWVCAWELHPRGRGHGSR